MVSHIYSWFPGVKPHVKGHICFIMYTMHMPCQVVTRFKVTNSKATSYVTFLPDNPKISAIQVSNYWTENYAREDCKHRYKTYKLKKWKCSVLSWDKNDLRAVETHNKIKLHYERSAWNYNRKSMIWAANTVCFRFKLLTVNNITLTIHLPVISND